MRSGVVGQAEARVATDGIVSANATVQAWLTGARLNESRLTVKARVLGSTQALVHVGQWLRTRGTILARHRRALVHIYLTIEPGEAERTHTLVHVECGRQASGIVDARIRLALVDVYFAIGTG